MNSAMRITINVTRRDATALLQTAQQVKAIGAAAKGSSGSIGALGGSTKGATSAFGGFFGALGRGMGGMTNFGKNLQWTGRQIEFRFTLPIVAAMTAATKWALANESAMVRVRKVYGDGTESTKQLSDEMKVLDQYTLALSNTFGKNREEITGVAADWAAAGAAGAGLLRSVRLTLETSIAGDIDLAKATEALISIQAGYRLSTDQMRLAMAQLNAIENTTQVSTSDLIEVLSKTSGVGKQFGVEIRDVAAFSAVLVKVVGDAAESGTALKSIMTKVMAPTNQAAAAFKEMGIDIGGVFKNEDFKGRIAEIAVAFEKLDDGQKAFAARLIAGQWQINKFAEIMDDVSKGPMSRFVKAQQALADENNTKNLEKFNQEVITVLKSDPMVFARAWQMVRNELAGLLLLVMPFIISMVQGIANLVKKFRELSPATQKFIMYALMLLAAFGPLISYIGATITLLGTLVGALKAVSIALATNPWILLGVAIVAAMVAIVIFRKQIHEALAGVAKDFADIVSAVWQSLKALYQVVAKVVMAILDVLSYLNPFARHSPSLVENVQAGVKTILDEYSKLGAISGMLRGLLKDVDAFNEASAGITLQAQAKKQGQQRSDLAGAGASDQTLAAFDQMMATANGLRSMLPALKSQIADQANVVRQWSDSLKVADDALQVGQERLDALSDAAQRAGDQLDAARAVLDQLSNTGILGEAAADQGIFDTELAIKKLRLELLKLEQDGQGVNDVADSMAKLTGEIEKMHALERSLRLAGAGSDVLGPLQAQMSALEAQRRAMGSGGTGNRAGDITKQIDALEKQKEIMDLERQIKFDPLRRQLDLLRNGIQELPFPELMDRTAKQQKLVEELTKTYDDANAAVKTQSAVVDDLKKSRDAINVTYTKELDRLDQLENAYRDIESAINDAASAVDSLLQAQKDAAGASSALGPGGDWNTDVGGATVLGREGGADAMLEELKKLQEGLMAQLAAADPFKGLREHWVKFKHDWQQFWRDVKDGSLAVWDEIGSIASNKWVQIGGLILLALVSPMTAALVAIFLFRDQIGQAWDWVVEKTAGFRDGFMQGLQPVFDELAKWGELWGPIGEAATNVFRVVGEAIKLWWDTTKPILDLAWIVIRFTFGVIWELIKQTWNDVWVITKVIWTFIGEFLASALEILRGIFNVVLGLLTGDWQRVWDGLQGIFMGFWHQITSVANFAMAIFTEVIPAVLRNFVTMWTGIWAELELLFWRFLGAMREVGEKIGDKIWDIAQKIWEPFDWAFGKIRSAWDNSIGAIWDKIQSVGGFIGSATGALTGRLHLATGGIVYPRPGGVPAILGERGYAEKVVPLGVNRGGGDGQVINIYGDLSFPNVSGAGDADGFVRNLKVLASNA